MQKCTNTHITDLKDHLITQFGQDVEGYTALISQLLQMHSTNDLGKSIETEATSPNQCSLSIKKNTHLEVTIRHQPFLDMATLEQYRLRIANFDSQCFNVKVNFPQKTTTYYLANNTDIMQNTTTHYFYNCVPMSKTSELVDNLLANFELAINKNKNKLQSQTKQVIELYMKHCDKLPRFSVYEQSNPENKTFEVIISGIDECDATLLNYIKTETHALNVFVAMPLCIGELQCVFACETNEETSRKRKRQSFLTKIYNFFNDSTNDSL